ncbi:hypothetical protein AVEN_166110-1, partial [Araneus ventricosus]
KAASLFSAFTPVRWSATRCLWRKFVPPAKGFVWVKEKKILGAKSGIYLRRWLIKTSHPNAAAGDRCCKSRGVRTRIVKWKKDNAWTTNIPLLSLFPPPRRR